MTDLRQARYRVRVTNGVRVPASVPGMTLGGDVYLPETDEPVPTVVTLHSARRDGLGGIATRRYLRHLAERGYAAVYVDTYGVGGSDGLNRPILRPDEIADGVALVEWAAAQPWSTGRVGMWGYSHGAMITLAVAARRPAHLHAIFPIMGLTDPETDLVYPGGARDVTGLLGRLSVLNIIDVLVPPLHRDEEQRQRAAWAERLDRFEPWFVEAWRRPPGDPAWALRRVDVDKINMPAFCVTGWRDLFCGPMVDAYERISAPKQLLVGPWLHMFPDASPVEPVSSIDLACDWWERWLRIGEPAAVPDRREILYVQGRNPGWVELAGWLPRDPDRVRLQPTTDRRLVAESTPSAENVADNTVVTWESDPTVGALTGLGKLPILGWGHPLNQHSDDVRSLTFTGPPLPAALTVVGRPRLTLMLDRRTTANRCVAKLTEVDPDGRSVAVTTGLVDLAGSLPVDHPDRPMAITFDLDPTCYSIPAGHRIRLVLSDSDFPRLWPDGSGKVLSVRVGASSYLELPVRDLPASVRTTLPSPPGPDGERPRIPVPEHRWEIARDLHRGSARIALHTMHVGPYTQARDKFVTRDTMIEATVDRRDPAGATLAARGYATAETERGDKVAVTVTAAWAGCTATAAAEVRINGRVSFQKTWELSVPELHLE